MDENLTDLIKNGYISEVLLIDYKNEGHDEAFDFKILDFVEKIDIPLILFGLSSGKILDKT